MVGSPAKAEPAALIATTPDGSLTGSGRRRRASAKLNMADVAPMPMAMEKMEISVKPGFFSRTRKACLISDVMSDFPLDYQWMRGFCFRGGSQNFRRQP